MSDIKPTKTIVFKTVGKLEIPFDVYLPENASKVPILLWFHGGGLLQGRRDLISPHMRKGVQEYNYACISADYRLAPQASVASILEDVQDCIAFIRKVLSSHLPKDSINPDRLAVSGSSAGGYLALLAGLYCDPKPTVIAPIYPITDPLGTFFTNSQPPPMGRTKTATKEEMSPYLDMKADVVANSGPAPEDTRSNMYGYMMHAANLAQLLGVPDKDSTEPYRIARNVYKLGLPPAYILHGDADTAVGVEQADEVVGAIIGCGGKVVYERVHGVDHLFDNDPKYENGKMYEFVMRHLNFAGEVRS